MIRKTIYFIIALIFLISCHSKNQLHGVWIGAYRNHYSGADTIQGSLRYILDISEDKLIYKTFESQMYGEHDSVEVLGYYQREKLLIIDSDTFFVKNLNEDSLVLQKRCDHRSDMVFKRLPNYRSTPEVELVNRAFSFVGPRYTDSISFINDSLFLFIGNNFNTINRAIRWKIENYKSYNFLLIEQIMSPPILIQHSSEREVSLRVFSNLNLDSKLIEIISKKDTSGLVGNWVSKFNKDIPKPPSFPNDTKDFNPELHVRINEDSIEIEQFNRIQSRKWELDCTNEFIYFPQEVMEKQGVWKILAIERNNLIIERNNKLHRNLDKEVLKFVRENTK